jgi:hypothetical protein
MTEYTWTLAGATDIDDIVAMSVKHFQCEIDTIFNPEPITLARNLTMSVVSQYYRPGSELLAIARNAEGKLLAYTWAFSNDRASWSDDPMVSVRMVHVDLELSPRVRIQLIKDMMDHWERFANYAGNDIICSTSVRHSQDAFLKLHARNGYSVRGSYAYKKLRED